MSGPPDVHDLDRRSTILERDLVTAFGKLDDLRDLAKEHHDEDDRRFDLIRDLIDRRHDIAMKALADSDAKAQERERSASIRFATLITSVALLLLALVGNIVVTIALK